MKHFVINDIFSIEALDDRNWVIKRKQAVDTEKRKDKASTGLQVANTAIYGYYSTLQSAKSDMVELVAKTAGNYKDLDRWLSRIEEIVK